MILERKTRINIPDLKEQRDIILSLFQSLSSDNPENSFLQLAELMQMYGAAMKEINTKLDILDDEFQITHKHSPIHHIQCRVKNPAGIYKKMHRYGVPLSLESAKEHIKDIAGIRVVCNYIDDVYTIENMLLKQPDITSISRKDYILQPKENGYRSLHLIVKIPIFLSNKTEDIPVEIQMRTIAMDYWASLEHTLQYKNDRSDIEKYTAMLKDCSKTLADTEKTMQYIRKGIEEGT